MARQHRGVGPVGELPVRRPVRLLPFPHRDEEPPPPHPGLALGHVRREVPDERLRHRRHIQQGQRRLGARGPDRHQIRPHLHLPLVTGGQHGEPGVHGREQQGQQPRDGLTDQEEEGERATGHRDHEDPRPSQAGQPAELDPRRLGEQAPVGVLVLEVAQLVADQRDQLLRAQRQQQPRPEGEDPRPAQADHCRAGVRREVEVHAVRHGRPGLGGDSRDQAPQLGHVLGGHHIRGLVQQMLDPEQPRPEQERAADQEQPDQPRQQRAAVHQQPDPGAGQRQGGEHHHDRDSDQDGVRPSGPTVVRIGAGHPPVRPKPGPLVEPDDPAPEPAGVVQPREGVQIPLAGAAPRLGFRQRDQRGRAPRTGLLNGDRHG